MSCVLPEPAMPEICCSVRFVDVMVVVVEGKVDMGGVSTQRTLMCVYTSNTLATTHIHTLTSTIPCPGMPPPKAASSTGQPSESVRVWASSCDGVCWSS